MDDSLKNVEPRSLWEHFDAIRQIPHGSGSEAALSAHVRRVAEQHGAAAVVDRVGNVIIRVPATPGAEQAPVLILQGHLDMVCEKNAETAHDFAKDPIQLRREGDLLYARGTTLGADNGVGVAAALAAMTDPTVVHGPLELLFTLDEETGLTGARNLDATLLAGRTLLNLDSEEHGALFIGCAGGADSVARLPLGLQPLAGREAYVARKVVVKGLAGGHSGIDIPLGRGNALLLLRDALARVLACGLELQLVSFVGGSKHNAIPREAEALVWVRDPARLTELLRHEQAANVARYAGIEEGVRIEAEPAEAPATVWSPLVRDRWLSLLAALPHGVIRMSEAVPGLVETSNNVAVVTQAGGEVALTLSSRSSVNEELRRVQHGIVELLQAAGCAVHADEGYPGWKPDLSSPILARIERIFSELFGGKVERKAIHAGLECGLLGAKVPGMDMVSFGPDIHSPHSPTESVRLSSVEKFWRLLCGVLIDVTRK